RFFVVPGITAAAGCSAYAGIPLTHRDFAQTIQLVTGHTRKDGREPDWQSLAASQQTVVVYMGLGTSPLYRERLIAHGRSPTTPVAVIEDGTRPSQRVVSGILDKLPDLIERNGITSPALVVIGEVAALANHLQWYGDGATAYLDASHSAVTPLSSLDAE
ncbi:MAG: uroporphyrinogen-III C-methyltransferase, partial [Armatimonadota bacterium]